MNKILPILIITSSILFGSSQAKCIEANLNYEIWNQYNKGDNNIIKGNRLKESIMKGINGNIANARYAYNRALRAGLDCNAKMLLEISILGSGKVSNVNILTKSYEFPSFDTDVINVIKKWDFEPIDSINDTTIIRYPFVFEHNSTVDTTNNGITQGTILNQYNLIGGRSKADIMRVVMVNLSALRYVYNKRLKEKPGIEGKITIKFAIDEFGNVIFCKVIESTVKDDSLENRITEKIKKWIFLKIDKPGDVTEVVYPFIFSQDKIKTSGKILVAVVSILMSCVCLSLLIIMQIHQN